MLAARKTPAISERTRKIRIVLDLELRTYLLFESFDFSVA